MTHPTAARTLSVLDLWPDNDSLPSVQTTSEAAELRRRIAAGERGSAIEAEVIEWHTAWQLATGQRVTGWART